MHLKQAYHRFKAWQRKPFIYEFRSHEVQYCQNCGHDFTGNFCPYCSQRAGTGRITWETLRQGIMLLWGMDSRSMSNSLLQLFGRPGHFIREYISGKRMISFPPVKMLVIVALLVKLFEHFLLPEAEFDKTYDSGIAVLEWISKHKDWNELFNALFYILPTWLMFRSAPAYPRHTLPEGFFIQVFICIALIILEPIIRLSGNIIGIGIQMIYSIIVYWQLFGYRLWGTVWRYLLASALAFLFFLVMWVCIGFIQSIP